MEVDYFKGLQGDKGSLRPYLVELVEPVCPFDTPKKSLPHVPLKQNFNMEEQGY